MKSVFGGLRVVELSSGMAGPMATMILADHGADVVKVEPPEGDWARPLPGFLMWNRGKRSVVLDLEQEAGREQALRLAAGADVVLESLRGGTAERLGVGYEAVRAANPGVVYCSISGFGPAAAYEHVKAYEGTLAALTGRMTGLDRLSGGHPGVTYDRPAFTAAPVASFGAAQLAVHGIVAALLERARTGLGQRVDTSLLQGAVAFVMRQELGRVTDDQPAAEISPAAHRGIELCFTTCECADGRYIQMCARQDAHFRNWLRAVGLEEVLDDPTYARAPMGIPTVADVDALEARLRERMRTKTQAEWMRIFTEEFDVGADPFLTPAEFLAHPDMLANDRIVEIDDPTVGRTVQLGPLVTMSDTPASITRSAPRLGEHTAEVLGAPPAVPAVPAPAAGAAHLAQPLAGITLLEVAYFIAGPLATTILGEMGAHVIKVEPLEGDPYRRTGLQSAKFVQGKESIALDLKSDAGQEILRQLIARSDAVVHSFRAGAAKKLGLDAGTVHGINPRSVHLYAGSYGSNGPQAHRAAFHSTPNALTGGGVKQAGEGNAPVNDSYADPGSALGAATALLLGLYAREATGRGQQMESTMLCSTGYIHSADMVRYEGAPPWQVADAGQHGLGALYRLYPCRTGWLFLAVADPREWERLVAALGRPELTADARFATPSARGEHDAELAEVLVEVLAGDDAAAWQRRLGDAGVGAAAAADVPFDGWLLESGLLAPADHPAYGPYWRLPAKVAFSGSAPRLAPAAGIGEHSHALLAELGYDEAAVERLVAEGVTNAGPAGGAG